MKKIIVTIEKKKVEITEDKKPVITKKSVTRNLFLYPKKKPISYKVVKNDVKNSKILKAKRF